MSIDDQSVPGSTPFNADDPNCRPNARPSNHHPNPASTATLDLEPASPQPGFFAQAVQSAGMAILSLNVSGTVTSWNAAATRLFGLSERDALGKSLELLSPPEYRSLINRVLQRTISQRSVNDFEISLMPPGAKAAVHVNIMLSCVIDKDDRLAGLVAWIRNISGSKALESKLSQAAHMASLGTLAAGVAHHFNNIICGMSAMVDFALSTEDPTSMKRGLKMAAEAASRINYITQSLMAFSAYDQAKPDLADLSEVLLQFADAIEPTLARKGIKLEMDLQSRRTIAVPRHRFSQILHHLLSNSEQALGEVLGNRKITLRTLSQEDQVMVLFADNGPGISSENLPHVFDPFFTTKGAMCGGCGNNPGLGLTIVHGAIMDLGGHVWADSTPNAGTTINILLPVS